MWSDVLKARIRRRKQTEAVSLLGRERSSFTEESSGLPAGQLSRGRQLLRALKMDQDCLSEEDCLKLMRLMGLNPSSVQFERSMARMSPDPVTTCTWGQFCHIWKDGISAEEHSRAMLEKAFPFFDQDGSGFITCEEMKEQFAELGGLLTAEEIHKFHSVLDRDGNGVIDYGEFIAALQPQIADDTTGQRSTATFGSVQQSGAAESPTQLLMQPEQGDTPMVQQTTVEFCSTAHVGTSSVPGECHARGVVE
eukprot:jgi/Ulvmu1/5617/UM023_0156.1